MFASTRCLEALRNTCQYPWHLHALLGPTVTLSCKHSCSSETKIFSPWHNQSFHLISHPVSSAEENLGIVPLLLPPCPQHCPPTIACPNTLPGWKSRWKGLGKRSHAVAGPFLCQMYGWLLLSVIDTFEGTWEILLLYFSNCNSWDMGELRGLFFPNWTSFFPQPCCSNHFPWTDSQLEAIISSIQTSWQTLKWLQASYPSHTDDIWPTEDHPMSPKGGTATSPEQPNNSLCSTLPASISFSPDFCSVNTGWKQNFGRHCNMMSPSPLLVAEDRIEYTENAVGLHPHRNWDLLSPCWACEGSPLAVCPDSCGFIFGPLTDSQRCLRDSSSFKFRPPSTMRMLPPSSAFKPLSSCLVWFGFLAFHFSHVHLRNQEMPWREIASRLSILFGSLFSVFLAHHQVLSTLNLQLHFFFFFFNWGKLWAAVFCLGSTSHDRTWISKCSKRTRKVVKKGLTSMNLCPVYILALRILATLIALWNSQTILHFILFSFHSSSAPGLFWYKLLLHSQKWKSSSTFFFKEMYQVAYFLI